MVKGHPIRFEQGIEAGSWPCVFRYSRLTPSCQADTHKDKIHMDMLRYFLGALATVLNLVLTLYMWVIIARAVLSWVSPDPYNPIVRFIYNVTEPVLAQIRRRLPVSFSGIDFSPIIVLLLIIFLQNFVVNYLVHLSHPLPYR